MTKVVISKEVAEDIGTSLTRIRIKKGKSQSEVVKAMGKAQPFVSSIESTSKVPTLATVVKYLDAIGCELVIRDKK